MNCQVTDAGLAGIDKLSKLVWLSFFSTNKESGCRGVTDQGIESLVKHQHPRQLHKIDI